MRTTIMSKEEKLRAYEMLLDGKSCSEVGKEFGVTKQRISQLFRIDGIRLHQAAGSCIYPNLALWMVEHNVGYSKMARAVGTDPQTIRRALTADGTIRKHFIDAILDLTGMTYEEAFAPKEN